MNFDDFLQSQLSELTSAGLKRSLRPVDGFQGVRLNIDGRVAVNFCSNNYLGLAGDSRLAQAAIDCMKEEGFGAGASRLICGNMAAHRRLEARLAAFKGTESCLLFSTGYMANTGIISSIFDRDDVIFSDRLNHASIYDGIQLSEATMKRYRHTELDALEEMLKDAPGKKRGIITDSVFSMDGDLAPLERLCDLAEQYDCILMVDEAHALGVFGKKGSGLIEHLGLNDRVHIQIGTLSKAAGSFGAYCCGKKGLINYLINKARSFIYTTAIPPVVAAASQMAIDIIDREHQTRDTLWENARYLLAQLKMMRFDTGNTQSPIIPIIVKDNGIALEFSFRLFRAGIFVSAIRPPTVPPNTARLRLTVMAKHSKEDLDYTLNHLERIGRELCLI